MPVRYPPAYALPAVLALLGPAVLIAATHGGFLPFALGWWLVSLLIALVKRRRVRIGITVALVPICVVTAFEGGLYMLPAVFSMLVIDLRTGQTSPRAGSARPSGGQAA